MPAEVTTSTVLGAATNQPLAIAPGVLLLLGQSVTPGLSPWQLDGLYLKASWLRRSMENDWLNEDLIDGEYIQASQVPIARVKARLRWYDADAGQWKLKPSISSDGTFLGIKADIKRWEY